ncbi:hypothetical protein M011DRAFT_455582 [Sporormia fimetaria CBS 119925]|uniref:Uncharacterized protein n=1 Tax=Sporormia fimetaria CBS 119925 TaxID=1340428 RepID=A0A6A6VIU1_9PLEO|nr:hypothetical protein M011DRAFT_455582 [Sporormia fimetaria CBS 119925]
MSVWDINAVFRLPCILSMILEGGALNASQMPAPDDFQKYMREVWNFKNRRMCLLGLIGLQPGESWHSLLFVAKVVPNVKHLRIVGEGKHGLGASLFHAIIYAFRRQLNTPDFVRLELFDEKTTTKQWTTANYAIHARHLMYENKCVREMKLDSSILAGMDTPLATEPLSPSSTLSQFTPRLVRTCNLKWG